jgi:hypothetical protein
VWNDCVGLMPGVVAPRRGAALSPEQLFDNLDGRMISAGGRNWLVEVYSVCVEKGATWLQVGLEGASSVSVLMRMARDEGPAHAIRYLSSWLGNPADRSHIVNGA